MTSLIRHARPLRDALDEGRRRAAKLGRPVLVSTARPWTDSAECIAMFAASPDVARFYWARPSQGLRLAGVGQALAVQAGALPCSELRLAQQAMLEEAVIEAPDAAGAGPVCLAGLRFDPAAPIATEWRDFGTGLLFLPELLFAHTPEGAWLTFNTLITADSDTAALERRLLAESERRGASAMLVSAPLMVWSEGDPGARERWEEALSQALRAIREGTLQKAVLARRLRLEAGRVFDPALAVERLERSHPHCAAFAVSVNGTCFIGATPETLVTLEKGKVSSTCLAGTASRGLDAGADRALGEQLLASAKERWEHALAAQAVQEGLASLCTSLQWEQTPQLVKLPTVQHLATSFTGHCRPGVHVLDMVDRLHPTPAVAGAPRAPALALIREAEGFDRGWYAGPIGIVDRHGDGEFALALRCGLLHGRRATIYAGAGIVAGSEPDGEWAETELKLKPLQRALAGE